MDEYQIRPKILLERYLELSREDAKAFFSEDDRTHHACPLCGSKAHRHEFCKWGFDYVSCDTCGSLFLNPRPSGEAFSAFYRDSPSTRFWVNEFFPEVAEIRREKLFRPKVEKISALCRQRHCFPEVLVDAGAGYGLFLEEWRRTFPQTELIGIEPNPIMAGRLEQKGFKVLPEFIGDQFNPLMKADMVVSLEVIEHVYDPLSFCSALKRILKPGGMLLLTGLCCDGFDIRVLWDASNSISPPHHINFPSIQGFKQLMERCEFSNVDVFTPGKLDVDIVNKAFQQDNTIFRDNRFLEELFKQDKTVLDNFQKFLSQNCFSSHCWVLAQN